MLCAGVVDRLCFIAIACALLRSVLHVLCACVADRLSIQAGVADRLSIPAGVPVVEAVGSFSAPLLLY